MNAPTSIDEYIAGFPKDIQAILEQVRATIRKAAPTATEKISYQMPTFFLHKNLVHFAVAKKHIGFYPTPSAIEVFKDEISAYKWSKGAVQFPIDKPMPLDLISRMVKYRVAEELKRDGVKSK